MIPVEEGVATRALRLSSNVARLASLVLLQINLISSAVVLGLLGTITFSLGMFYAADPVFYPLFDVADLRQVLLLSLPGTILSVMVSLATLSLLPLKGKSEAVPGQGDGARPSRGLRAIVIGVCVVLVCLAADIIGMWFAAFAALTFSLVFLAVRARDGLKGRMPGWLYALVRAGITASAVLMLTLILVFALGFLVVLGKLDAFEDSRTFLVSPGARQKVAVLIPGRTHSIIYDGKQVRAIGDRPLDRIVVLSPQRKSIALCKLDTAIKGKPDPAYC